MTMPAFNAIPIPTRAQPRQFLEHLYRTAVAQALPLC